MERLKGRKYQTTQIPARLHQTLALITSSANKSTNLYRRKMWHLSNGLKMTEVAGKIGKDMGKNQRKGKLMGQNISKI